ncbi:MAG TPA: spermidine/putrescine ABC transporter substrate-binding protein [Geminicoccaceae bacterium]|nr:spermidine/putrescine ABC transporter substrate-binding protein [Geminicoccaceae bacterium]
MTPRRRPTPSLPAAPATRRRFIGGAVAVAATVPALSRLARAQGGGVVSVYNWDTYIGETTLEDFTDATGLDVRYDLYASNDELFARLREGNPGYDVIFPTNDYVERMVAAGMVQPLDHARIPNMANIDPAFENPPFDPGRAYSMPYFWGTVGIGYRASRASPSSWADLFASEEHAGRIALLQSRDTIDSALKYLGHSLNTEDPAQIEEAARVLIAAKPRIKAFAPDTGQDLLIAGEVDLCLEYNGDILQVMAEDDDLAYVVPEEGALLWEDTMCVPTGAPNPDGAHAFINFILEGEVHGAIATFVQYPCPNAAAMEHIPEVDRTNPSIYPSREVLRRCEVSVYKGEGVEQLYSDALTRVLAA